jgi:hypothetical protein
MPMRTRMIVLLANLSALVALGQPNISLDINLTSEADASTNVYVLAQTGSVGSLGNATLVFTESSAPILNNSVGGPVQIAGLLAFNQLDTITLSFTVSDPDIGPLG